METFFLIGLSSDGSEKSLYKEYRMKDEQRVTKKKKVDEGETSTKVVEEVVDDSLESM